MGNTLQNPEGGGGISSMFLPRRIMTTAVNITAGGQIFTLQHEEGVKSCRYIWQQKSNLPAALCSQKSRIPTAFCSQGQNTITRDTSHNHMYYLYDGIIYKFLPLR
jgi:hypothetical protein